MPEDSLIAAAQRGLMALAARPDGPRPPPRPLPRWMPADPARSTWAELLSVAPTIIQTFPSVAFPLGAASAVGPMLRDRHVHFLIMLAWTIEVPGASEFLDRVARSYLADHPRHALTFLCSTPRETDLMAAAGHAAVTLCHNCLMDDAVFRPLPEVEPIYDAVHNGRLSPQKRPELAAAIDKVAFIYYYNADEGSPQAFHTTHARYAAMMPNARFLNALTSDGCAYLPPRDVNVVLAQSRVGLCLSAIEGSMRASIEYLFAGLSIVSTPSLGGRDRYFDDEYCLVVDPDPRSIGAAVQALVARKVPRDYVRAKTLARVEAERRRYIALVQDIIDRAGGHGNFARRFWECTRGPSIMRWRPMPEFAAMVGAIVAGARRG